MQFVTKISIKWFGAEIPEELYKTCSVLQGFFDDFSKYYSGVSIAFEKGEGEDVFRITWNYLGLVLAPKNRKPDIGLEPFRDAFLLKLDELGLEIRYPIDCFRCTDDTVCVYRKG